MSSTIPGKLWEEKKLGAQAFFFLFQKKLGGKDNQAHVELLNWRLMRGTSHRAVFTEQLGDWTDLLKSEPPCDRRVPHGQTECGGYSTRRHMLEPVRPEAVLPDMALCLPTFSLSLIVNKTSL